MGEGKKSTYNVVLVIVIVAALALLFFENANALTGNVVQQSTVSNVTIQAFFSVQWSTDLTDGIVYEDVLTLPTTDQNATQNYAGAGNSSGYYVTINADSNRDVDFCLSADDDLISVDLDRIGLANETYTTNVTSSNSTTPDISLQIPMTTTFNKSVTDVAPGQTNFYRFWLDIPAGQAPGTYTNNVNFKGVVAGATNATCG